MSVTRYDHHHECGIVDSESGKYILHSDYEKLERKFLIAEKAAQLSEEKNSKLLTHRNELLAAAKEFLEEIRFYFPDEKSHKSTVLETAIKSTEENK